MKLGKWFLSVTLCYALLSLVFFALTGVREGGDSSRFIEGANRIAGGLDFQGKQGNYAGYCAVVWLFLQVLDVGKNGLIIFQVLIGGSAVIWFAHEAGKVFGVANASVGMIFCLFFPDWLKWNFYVLSDGLFVSSVLLFFAALMRSARRPNFGALSALLVLSLFAISLRPSGWVVQPVLVVGLLYSLLRGGGKSCESVVVILLSSLAFVWLTNLGPGAGSETPLAHLLKGEIFWRYGEWRLLMPGATEEWSSFLSYVRHHPIESAGLGFLRVIFTIIPVRADFSLLHNGAVAVFVLVFWIGVFWGRDKMSLSRPLSLIVLFTILQLALAAVFFADRDARWILYWLPLWSPFVGCGLVRMWTRFGPFPSICNASGRQ